MAILVLHIEVGNCSFRMADATWTLYPKHEWDVTAGVALVKAAGEFAQELDNSFLRFNNRPCILPNLLAGG
jgi:myo-inositol-1(or 4)-monophosphatase